MTDYKMSETSWSESDLSLGVRASGHRLLEDPLLNKGSAFDLEERQALGLEGLLPPAVQSMDQQLERVRENYQNKGTDLERFIFLAALHDRNETLFYRFLLENVEELLPIVYTPVVGEACQKYSHIYRKARGLYVTPDHAGRIRELLDSLPPHDVRVIVVTDNERILGLGDLGVGGMGIPVGKLTIYSGAAGIHPSQTLPVSLDVGTNNPELLGDPLYLGRRKPRLQGQAYDDLIEEFVNAVADKWPGVLLQWEDFANKNAFRLLERYRDRLTTFNDDIQGTGAVTVAGIFAASRARRTRVSEETIAFFGAGEASAGIADQIVAAMVAEGTSAEQALRRIWMLDSKGLLVAGTRELQPHKVRFARRAADVEKWAAPGELGTISLLRVVEQVKPSILIGASGTPGTFTEPVLRALAAGCDQPVIMPLSNPTSKAEVSPAQAYEWTDGRCLVATGSPFKPVEREGRRYRIGQANNAFIFPGVGLGVLVSRARRVTDGMFRAAALALADTATPEDFAEGALYPPVARIRDAGRAVAIGVAREAIRSGQAAAELAPEEVPARVDAAMWWPEYVPYRKA